ncbi:MAG: hypothetical protein AAFU03_07490, partial [Bacteroidota bacterium]
MRPLILFLLLLGGIAPLASQDDFLAIEERMQAYHALGDRGEYDAVLNYIYPPLFELIPREVLRDQFAQENYHPDFTINRKRFSLDDMGYPMEVGSNTYVRLLCSYTFTVTFYQEAAEDEDFIEATLESISQEHGGVQIIYDPLNHQASVRLKKSLLAVRPDASLTWYFLEVDYGQLELLGDLVPAS